MGKESYLFVCENLQELEDISLLAQEIKKTKKDINLILIDIGSVFHLHYPHRLKNKFNEVISFDIKCNNKFSFMNKVQKLYISFLLTYKISKIIRVKKISKMISGVPLVFFRWSKLFNKNITYISYIRAILASNDDKQSWSSRMHNRFGNVVKKSLRAKIFFNNWYADYIATICESNKRFLLERGILLEHIIEVGPIHLSEIKKNLFLKNKQGLPKLIFATSAYKAHNRPKLAEDQKELISKIVELYMSLYSNKFDLEIRLHPRDDKNFYKNIMGIENVKYNEEPMNFFLSSVNSNSFLLSNFSTLNFEWQSLGGYSGFIMTTETAFLYEKIFRDFNISPEVDLRKCLSCLSAFFDADINEKRERKYPNKFYWDDKKSNLEGLSEKILSL